MPPEKCLGVGCVILKFSSTRSDCCSLCRPTTRLSWSYPESSRFSIVRSSFLIKCGQDVNIVCVAFLVSEEYSITRYKFKDCLDLWQNEEATSDRHHQWPSVRPSLWIPLDCWIRHFSRIAGVKLSGFERKAFTRQNFPDSKVFGFKVPTLDSGLKISGDMTKPGCFHFGFVLLCANGKTNPVLKRSGFITNPEQFPLV